jgi:riboflavin synthase
MFTGIVEEVGTVRLASPHGLTIDAHTVLEGARLGDSIAINGACLTLVARDERGFSVQTVPETLRRTNLSRLRPGDPVNLERSLAAGARLGGHMVQGHVEGTGTITALAPEREALMMRVETAPELLRYIVRKGFVAVDGTSLTVVDCDSRSFRFTLIPYTQEHTILGRKGVGDLVNLETDILGRYVAHLLGGAEAPSPEQPTTIVTSQQVSEDQPC